ncbi:MAG: OmpA family protein [Saprospiraceae bacterium]
MRSQFSYSSTFANGFISKLTLAMSFVLLCLSANAQVILQGYVYESGNRGYLETAKVTVLDESTKALKGEIYTDENGKFELAVDAGKSYLIRINKKPFEPVEQVVSAADKIAGDKLFAKFEMERMPGYIFEVTLAPARDNEDVVVDAITGAWIEVYNNTNQKEVLNLKDHPSPTFSCRFEQGNHYTVLLRKEGFYNKRLEAYVNVQGCILCFDGVGEVKPGVAEVLTEGFEMGTLLANVELQPVTMNKEIEINNIYYDVGSARLKSDSREELDELAVLLNDNKNLLIEIGSHTDSRGDRSFNQKLSLKRAQSVVKYLIDKGVEKEKMTARGYGESKLRNSCGDGVECSERRHQKNRRTEFKVIGVVHDNLQEKRSLAEMKDVENMEKLLAELEGSEIKVGANGELPDELKKQLAQQEEAKANPPKKENPPVEPKPQIKPKAKVVEAKPIEASEVSLAEMSKEQILNETVQTEKEESVPTEKEVKFEVKKQIEKPSKPQPKLETVNSNKLDVTPEVKRPKSNNVDSNNNITWPDSTDEEEEDFEDNAIYEVYKDEDKSGVKTKTFVRAPKKLPVDYTGYKVQIVISTYELPLSHEIFSSHGNIMLEETKHGTYAYVLGDFERIIRAEEFLDNVLSRRYANARVIEYLNGRRIVR